jgi:putative DNA primase/helicase
LNPAAEVTAFCLHERYYSFMQGGRPRHRCRDCACDLVEVEDEIPAAVVMPPEPCVVSAAMTPDLTLARAYLEALTGEKNPAVTFQTFADVKDQKAKRDPLAGWLHGTLDRYADELTRRNERGAGIFVMVNKGDGVGRKAENVVHVRALYADRDRDGARPPALTPSFSVATSPGKKHDYLLVAGEMPLEDFTPFQETLADYCGSDRSVNDLPRVARLPGFYHRKKAPVLVTFEPGCERAYTPDEILRAHPVEPRKPAPSPPKKSPRPEAGPRREKLMQIVREKAEGRDWSEGNRHASAKATAAHGRKIGLEAEELAPIVVDFAERAGLPREEAEDVVTWAMASVTPDPAEKERPRAKAAAEKDTHTAENTGGATPWPTRKPLPPLRCEAPSMPAALVPPALRTWLTDEAARLGACLEFLAVPAIVAAGSLLGRSLTIRPKARDRWTVSPNLWGANVGRPSALKTPAQSAALAPLRRIANEAFEDFKTARDIAAARVHIFEKKREGLLRKVASGKIADASAETMLRDMEGEIASAKASARRRRLTVNDATVEALQEILSANPRGILQVRDELSGWLRQLDRDGHEADRPFFLEAYEGGLYGDFESDRVARGNTRTAGPCVSILGTIQPGRLDRYVRGAVAGRDGADGLLQRFQLIAWPDDSPTRGEDREPDAIAFEEALRVFRALDSGTPSTFGAEEEEGAPPFLRFAPDAQALFDKWQDVHYREIRADSLKAAPFFEEYLVKQRKTVPALALIFHAVSVVAGSAPPGPVPASALDLALNWGAFLRSHGEKVYAVELRSNVAAAEALAAKLEARAVPDGATVSDLGERDWAGLEEPALVHAALDVLEHVGWVRRVPEPTAGRTRIVIRVHPDFRRAGA